MSICNQTPSRPAKNSKLVKRFLRDTKGSITPLMGLVSIPFFLAAGAAIDMSRATREQQAFYGAVDSAALAIAADDRSALEALTSDAAKETRRAELEVYAEKFLNKNYKDASHGASSINVDLSINGSEIKIDASLQFPMTITRLAGFNSMTLNAKSTVKKAMRPIELVMVMDTTGSMEDVISGTTTKIQTARLAGQKLLETLYEGTVLAKPNSQDVRVSLVPFSGAVRLDTAGHDFSNAWIDQTGINPLSRLNFDHVSGAPAVWNNHYAWSQMRSNASTNLTWNGCVESRAIGASLNVNDTAPSAGTPATLFPAYLNPDTFGAVSSSAGAAGYTYIPTGSTSATSGNECAGLSSTICSDTSSTAARLTKQENWRKYIGYNVGFPVSETTPLTTNIKTSQYVGPWGGCAVNKIVSLTHDRSKVETAVTSLRAHGVTNIPEGLAWGWRVLSPTAPFTQVQGHGSIAGGGIAPYDSPRWKKIMVLMTDGDNNLNEGSYSPNNSGYSAYGLLREPTTGGLNRMGTTSSSNVEGNMDTYMSTVCTNIKAQGITIYVTSFGADVSSTTRTNLKNCSSGDAYYKHNSTSSDLVTFFNHIGQDVLNKSIYVSK